MTTTLAICASVNESALLTTAPKDTVTCGESALAPSSSNVTLPLPSTAPGLTVVNPSVPAMESAVAIAKRPGAPVGPSATAVTVVEVPSSTLAAGAEILIADGATVSAAIAVVVPIVPARVATKRRAADRQAVVDRRRRSRLRAAGSRPACRACSRRPRRGRSPSSP